MSLFDIYNAAGHLRDLSCIVMHSPAILATSAPYLIINNNML